MGRGGQVRAAGTNKKNLWLMTPELKQDRTSTKMMAKQDLGLLGAFDSEIHYCYYAILYNIGVMDEEHAILGSAKDCKPCVLESSHFSFCYFSHVADVYVFKIRTNNKDVSTSL